MRFEKKPQRKSSNVDLEEIRPHHFYVHEPYARGLLKGEGTFKGQVFELTSWRRDGLMARLRDHGFVVRTLADQIERLPRLPRPAALGPEASRPLANTVERFSYFDSLALAWVPVESQVQGEQPSVTLRAGWIVRRRRGRGAASYYEVFVERTGGAGLRLLNEDTALMAGYSQATALRERDLVARHVGKAYLLPDLELPKSYRDLLGRMAERTPEGLQIHERGWPLVQEVFARLGLLLRGAEGDTRRETRGDTRRETRR